MYSLLMAYDFVAFQLRTNPNWLTNVKWLANFNMFASAIAVSLSPEISAMALAFLGFFIAHVVWATAAIIMKDKPLLVLNAGFLPLDLWAMWIRL